MMDHLPYLVAAWIFGVGVYGIATSTHLVHLCVCLGVVQTSTYVLLTGIGYRHGGAAPILNERAAGTFVDPVVQALMLTDVVVEATVVALLLALVVRIHQRTGSVHPDKIAEMRG